MAWMGGFFSGNSVYRGNFKTPSEPDLMVMLVVPFFYVPFHIDVL